MARRNAAIKREVLEDPKYKSIVITKLVNQVMQDGKKGTAQKIVYDALDSVEKKLGAPGIDIFSKALENIMPVLETKGRRVGGSTYQVPIEVRPSRRQTLGIRMLVDYSKKRNEKSMSEKLAGEILDAYNETGGAFKRKEEIHRTADANKAFAHFKY